MSIILSTLGKYIFDPSMQAYLGDRIPYARRGRTIAVTEFGWSLAFILGIPLMGFLIARSGWMAPFPLMALLGVLIFVGLFWMLPKEGQPAADNPSLFGKLSHCPDLRSRPGGTGGRVVCQRSQRGGQSHLRRLAGGILRSADRRPGRSLGRDRALRTGWGGAGGGLRRPAGQSRVPSAWGWLPTAWPPCSCFSSGAPRLAPWWALFFFYITFEFTLVSIIPLMTEVLPSARATLMAFNVAALSLGRALGDLLAPRLYLWGFWSVVMGAVAFNLLALLALRKVKTA